MFRKKEKADLEPKQVEKVVEVNDRGEEIADVLVEETEFEIIETRNKVMKKRKNVAEDDQPYRKKKKYDNIMNWGETDEREDEIENGVRAWLIGGGEGTSAGNDNILEVPKNQEPKKLEQLELELEKRVAEAWPTLSPEMVPDGLKEVKTRKKTLKKLATENKKLSSWIVNTPSRREDARANDEMGSLLRWR